VLGPIFNREFLTVPRRKSTISAGSRLGLLWVIGLTAWQATVGFNRIATLGETARFGLLFFQIIAYVELTLLLFFSALSAASTVSQEKDRRTFVLLLLTDMRDYEIVLGKMLGSLLPIIILLAVTMPVLAMTLLLGGVSAEQVAQAGLVLLATSLAAGSLGGLIALWRDRTSKPWRCRCWRSCFICVSFKRSGSWVWPCRLGSTHSLLCNSCSNRRSIRKRWRPLTGSRS